MTGGAAGTVVRLAERAQGPDGSFGVRVSFGDWAEYDVTVADPADAAAEGLLAWYFEQHLRFPFLDKDLERAAVRQIAAYGEALFSQVFGGAASHEYRLLRDIGFDGCRVEVSGSAGLHRLHWEALRDPGLPAPLAVRLPVTRRADRQGLRVQPPSGWPTVNILVVVARPDGPRDVGYRTVSRPLLDALRTAGLPVTVDLVRPGTWDALRGHLQAVREERGPGWYQVAHFDLHGSFSDYAALEAGRAAERLVFAPAALESSFEGQQGFLYFETAETGKAGPVAAGEVAELLAEHRVPVAVLNACQSAMQAGSEAGLAQRLAEAGVPVAVGMAYSVTVSAAERAMPKLYGRLAGGADPVTAVHAARRELFEHPARKAYFAQQLDLQDWMLPVVFAQQPLHIDLRPMTGDEQAAFYGRAAKVGPEPATEYGFVGRDLDIQAVEHELLASADSNQLLVRGMAGAGKSTLLNHLAWWWQRTGLVEEVFRFSYEDRAWTSAQITRAIRAQLLSPAEHAQADSMPEEAQAERVAALLRARRHLLILDNTESVTAAPAAIPHALPPPERDKLKGLLAGLRGGRTLVLLGSREPETWLTSGGGPGVYPLPGLDPQAASVLVEKILARHGSDRYLREEAERDALQELVKLLGGYPLPLTVVLPVLAATAPSVVLAELKAGGSGADPAGLIRRAIEYSHGKLDPALQDSLLLLAPFTAVIPAGPILDTYRELLLEHDAVRALGPVDLGAALEQAVSVGLAAPHPQLGHLVQVQPVLPWFLRSRLHDKPALAAAVAVAHYQLYTSLAPALYDMLTSPDSPQRRLTGQAATAAEYANLTTALDHGLHTSQPVIDIVAALNIYLDQAQQHEVRRQLLTDTITAYPPPATSSQQTELARLNDMAGHAAIRSHHLDEARARYETVLQLLQATGNRESLGSTYHQLGAVAQRQRRFADAAASYRQALDIKLEFGDRRSAANTYHQLAMVAQEQRRFAEADASYRQALDIKLEFGARYSAASTYYQLGRVAEEQGRFAEAEASYRQAHDIYLEFGDRYETADIYHQLGRVAQEQGRFTEAEASYRQALEIFLEFGDRHGAARAYHQLAMVAEDQRRFAEAEASYRQALDIFLEFGDRYSAASTYHQLGQVAQQQRRFAEAEASYRQALDIYLESGDRRSASGTATLLGIIYVRLGQQHQAARILLSAAASWHQETGQWATQDLRWLHRQRAAIGTEEFTALMTAEVPADLTDELTAAIDTATDPEDAESTA